MAVEATPPFHNPLERLGHAVREVPAWAGRHWKSLLLIAATGGITGSLYFLHDSGTQKAPVQPNNPVTDTFKPSNPDLNAAVPAIPTETPIPTATASATPEPPKPTATPEPPKPLPEVINNQTVKFVSLSANEVQNMIDAAKQKGEHKISSPEELKNKPALSLVEVKNVRGWSGLALTASQPGIYDIPALEEGKVDELFDKGIPSIMGLADQKTNQILSGVVLPEAKINNQVNFRIQKGDTVIVGQTIATVDYNPNNEIWKNFIKNCKAQGNVGIPENTIALFTTETGKSLTIKSLLTASDGSLVTTSSK